MSVFGRVRQGIDAVRDALPTEEAKQRRLKAAAKEQKAARKAAAGKSPKASKAPAVPSWQRKEPAGPRPAVRIGFVGAGNYAQHHLRALSDLSGVDLVSLLTTGGPRARTAQADYGFERTFTDLDAFCAQDDLDAFVVVVPPVALPDIAQACVETGRPLLMEKPPAVTAARARALAGAARSAGTWGMVGMNRRFFSVVEHGLAALGSLGPVRGALLEVPQPITPDRQSGRLTEFDYDAYYARNSIHGVDLLRYVMGDPVAVHSLAWENAEFGNAAASYAALLQYPRGVVASIVDLWDTPSVWRLKVVAEQGWVEWEPLKQGFLVNHKGKRVPLPVDAIDERFRAGVWAQALAFVEAVRSGEPPPMPACTLDDAVGTMELIEAIRADTLGAAR